MKCKLFLFLSILTLSVSRMCAQMEIPRWLNEVEIRAIASSSAFPQNSVNAIYQSDDGFVWFGTDEGLFCYDGIRFRAYRNDIQHPSVLTSNTVLSVISTGVGTLWVGTDRGLNRIDSRTGESRQYHFTDFPNSDNIGQLLCLKSGQLWLGTEGGVYIYHPNSDSFELMCDQRGNSRVPHCAIKSMFEDAKGYVWIGTWDKGVFRFSQKTKEWYEMPKFNDINSGQVVHVDSNHKLWVGTWGKGIYRIDNPYDTYQPLRFKNFMIHSLEGGIINSNYIHSIVENRSSHRLWIGTDMGLSFCDYNSSSQDFYLLPSVKEPRKNFFSKGVDQLLFDHHGNIFLNASKTGVAYAVVVPHHFHGHSLFLDSQTSDVISNISYDNNDNVWVSLNENKLKCLNVSDATDITNTVLPPSVIEALPKKVNCVFQSRQGTYYIGTDRAGLYVFNPNTDTEATVYNRDNCEWLKDNCIYSIVQDKEDNLIIGGWHGISVLYANGKGLCLDTIVVSQGEEKKSIGDYRIKRITQANDGSLWLTLRHGGMIRIIGNIHLPERMKATIFSTIKGSDYVINDAVGVVEDSRHRIWACSRNIGLMLYNSKEKMFESVSRKYGIPNENIYSIETACDGCVWLSTRQNLMRLTLSEDDGLQSLNFFSVTGMQDFSGFASYMSAVSPSGNIAFAGTLSYATFHPLHLPQMTQTAKVAVTGIRIFNTPVSEMTNKERARVLNALPPFTEKLELDQAHNNITIDFSTFNFSSAVNTRFAYILEGYDKDWVYAEQGTFSVSYSNLPSGKYKFRLRAADPQNAWTECETTLSIVVLPPLWLRWWAIMIYVVLVLALAYAGIMYYRSRLIHRQQLRIAQMEADKVEELNHKKLQFYTNITHDLMTPLTVIYATVDQMQGEGKVVVQNNVERLMRLLQQMLEFRKAETGNLRLRVSYADIADFCRREIESIRPLMQKKQIHLSLVTSPETLCGYFDSDALDKILYNLLSNAAKYNTTMGYVQVNLTQGVDNPGFVVISVKDSGVGIPKNKQRTIFKRFYEGEHRKFNTYGTGIGLSLTRDLVLLHHGTIDFVSAEGEGTTFTVTLPLAREYYADEEVEEMTLLVDDKQEMQNEADDRTGKVLQEKQEAATVLVVEDNDDISALLRHILSEKYNVLSAYNGQEGLDILSKGDIDLIVSDIMMPMMDGVEMLRRVRENTKHAHLPVVMLTAKRDDEYRAESYSAGADAYITKPFNASVLLSRVENLIERSAATKQELRAKDLLGMTDIKITDADEKFLKSCIECVQKNIGNADFDQQMFADLVGVSKSTLYKKLKDLAGVNTSAFIRNIRMKTACEILDRTPSIRISELAYSVGYNDPKYFSSCFKKDFGMLPSEYIAQK